MSKGDKIARRKVFNLYSQNLIWLSEVVNLPFNLSNQGGVLCPLCMKLFREDDIESQSGNFLTLEHNPPRSLGGKKSVLTCKECNSKCGHRLDASLLKYIEDQDFNNALPGSKHWTQLVNSSGNKVTTEIKYSDAGITLDLKREYSKPSDFEKVIRDFDKSELNKTSPAKFEFKAPQSGDHRLASIALLKIGFLLGFEKYGHVFLFNRNLDDVRRQILNPEDQIIADPFWINFIFPEKYLGVNLINNPKGLRSFLNLFKLKSHSSELQISVALPGYNCTTKELYGRISKSLCAEKEDSNVEINITNFESFVDIRDRQKIMLPYSLWLAQINKNK